MPVVTFMFMIATAASLTICWTRGICALVYMVYLQPSEKTEIGIQLSSANSLSFANSLSQMPVTR